MPGRYSTLAGFVEFGESLEEAVQRETQVLLLPQNQILTLRLTLNGAAVTMPARAPCLTPQALRLSFLWGLHVSHCRRRAWSPSLETRCQKSSSVHAPANMDRPSKGLRTLGMGCAPDTEHTHAIAAVPAPRRLVSLVHRTR